MKGSMGVGHRNIELDGPRYSLRTDEAGTTTATKKQQLQGRVPPDWGRMRSSSLSPSNIVRFGVDDFMSATILVELVPGTKGRGRKTLNQKFLRVLLPLSSTVGRLYLSWSSTAVIGFLLSSSVTLYMSGIVDKCRRRRDYQL
ncbi:hypothetical protein BJ912DRAFT_1056242 [Pholiota molesta]|nr:hypothetical protein BJ912DRAFT_1056242 [Pholiota molesta]